MNDNNTKTMYETVPAAAELNKVPGFDPLKFLRRTKDIAYITHAPSRHGEDIQNFFKESPAGIAAFENLRKNSTVTQKKNTVCVTCGKSIVCYH